MKMSKALIVASLLSSASTLVGAVQAQRHRRTTLDSGKSETPA